MANTIVGVITSIGDTQNLVSRNGNAFKRRDLIIMVRRFDPNTGEPINDSENTPLFTFMGERCDELNNYKPGQMVTIYFDIKGRKYTDQQGIMKIINDITPYKIVAYQPSYQPATHQQQVTPQPAMPQQSYQQPQQSYAPQQFGQPGPQFASQGQPAPEYKPPF